MAAGTLIAVLSNIPWGQVVENAPKVADGAVKLWNMVRNRKKPGPGAEDPGPRAEEAQSEPERLQARVQGLEESVRSLQEQMQASTELIKALAEQNTQLIQRIELNRVRLVRHAVASSLGGLLLLVAVIHLLGRG